MKSIITTLALGLCLMIMALPGFLPAQAIEFAILPFNRIGNFIYIKVEADQQAGTFLVDTGFRGILLNKQYFKGMDTDRVLVGTNGKGPRIQEKRVDLNFGLLKAQGVLAEIADISHLEKSIGISLTGVIGSTFFEHYEVQIDYLHNQLVLVRLDDSGEKMVALPDIGPPTDTLPFDLKGHIPVINAQIDRYSLRLGIDSGAGSNLFTSKRLKDLRENISSLRDLRLRGLGHSYRKARAGMLSELIILDIPLKPMRTLFANISHINFELEGPNLDGILGCEFLSQFKVAFNFKKQELYLWREETREAGAPSEILVKNRKD